MQRTWAVSGWLSATVSNKDCPKYSVSAGIRGRCEQSWPWTRDITAARLEVGWTCLAPL